MTIATCSRSALPAVRLSTGVLLTGLFLAFSCGGSSESGGGTGAAGGVSGGGTGGAGDTSGAGDSGGAPSETCNGIQAEYGAAVEAAKECSPGAAPDPCTLQIVEGLACSCPSFANPENTDALRRVAVAATAFRQHNCTSGVVCGACETPSGGRCSAAGRCEEVYSPGGRACKVGGVVYADGEGGIPDPTSCNQCSCADGQLACTEIYCPLPCPAGHTLGQQCAQCGPTDACLVVEHACFTACVDGCGEPGRTCVDGACVMGLCG
jgi:hypothetical protein